MKSGLATAGPALDCGVFCKQNGNARTQEESALVHVSQYLQKYKAPLSEKGSAGQALSRDDCSGDHVLMRKYPTCEETCPGAGPLDYGWVS